VGDHRKLENVWVNTRRFVSAVLLAFTLGGGLAACGSGGGGPTPSTTPPTSAAPSTSSASSGVAADVSAITANWTAFFNAKTPTSQRVNLLQNGQTFASVLQAQAGSSLASQASAKVTKVTVITTAQAAVTYDILVAGQPVLSNQSGTAVYQDGTWKVGDASFCGLLTLENSGSTSSLPAACKSPA